jgi:hypothetical protein
MRGVRATRDNVTRFGRFAVRLDPAQAEAYLPI